MYRAFDPEYLYPVDYEPAHYSKEEIICPGSDQEDDISVEERARKKRRIEEKGLEYLLGTAPFIFTATLRGPFDKGWRNPWAKRKDGHEVGHRDVTQDEVKLSSEEPPSVLPPPPPNVEHVPDGDDAPQDDGAPHITARRSPKDDRNKSHELVPLLPTPRQPSRSSPIRHSDWLKRDDGRRTIANKRQSLSPTTRLNAHEPLQKRKSSNARQKRMSQMELEKPFKIIKISEWDSQMERSMPKKDTSKENPPRKPHKHDQVKTVSMSRHNVLKQRSPKPIRLQEQQSQVKTEGDKESMRPAPRKRYVHRERTVTKESLSHMSHVDDSFKANPVPLQEQPKPGDVSHDILSEEVPKKYVSATSESSHAHSSSDERVLNVVDGDMSAQGVSSLGSPKARSQEILKSTASKHLSSKQNGSQVRDSRPTSRSANEKSNDKSGTWTQPHPQQNAQETKTSSVVSRKALSKESSNLPEAQHKDIPPPLPTTLTRSSTNLLETEKQLPNPIFGDGDSYMNMSTQAAIEKVGRKLQEDILTSFANPPAPSDVRKIVSNRGTTRQAPMNAQAMLNETAPFDISITDQQQAEGPGRRKSSRKRSSQQQSPSDPDPAPLRSYSPNMSTSVSRSNSYDHSSTPSSQAGDPTHPERSPPSFYMSASSKPSATISSHAHPPPSTDIDDLTSFSIQPDGTLIETRIYQDGQQRDPFPVPEEFTSLPSFSISSKPPTSSAYNKVSFSTTTNNHNHRSSQKSNSFQLPLQLSAEYHSQSQPLPHRSTKEVPAHERRPTSGSRFDSGSQRPSSQHNQHNQHNHRSSQASQSQPKSSSRHLWDRLSIPPPPLSAAAPAPAAADVNVDKEGRDGGESQNINTQDREAEKFIEDAGAGKLLGDGEWDLEREVRRMGRDGRDGRGGHGKGGDADDVVVREKKGRKSRVLR